MNARRLVNDDEGQRDDGVDDTGKGAVDEQGEEEPHRPQSAGAGKPGSRAPSSLSSPLRRARAPCRERATR
jgi:hypothetical protein